MKYPLAERNVLFFAPKIIVQTDRLPITPMRKVKGYKTSRTMRTATCSSKINPSSAVVLFMTVFQVFSSVVAFDLCSS